MWAIDVTTDENGKYCWTLWSAEGRRACRSAESYAARFNADRLSARFVSEARELGYETFGDATSGYGWRARTADGKAVATSVGTFASAAEAAEAADEVRRNAGGASIPAGVG